MTRTDSPLIRSDDRGLRCRRGSFWIDPWRPVDIAVVTHGHADHARPGCGRYYTARAGVPILRHRLGADIDIVPLDHGEELRLGEVTVSLHPAGHVLGSAQVRVAAGGEAWVVTGDFKRAADPTCTPFEPVPCDVLITEATFALPVYRWRPGAAVAADLLDWWRQCRDQGLSAILYCYALGKAQRVLAELAAQGFDETVFVHGAIEPIVRLYRDAGVSMPPTSLVSAAPADRDFRGSLVLAPPAAAGSTWPRRFAPFASGFASGWMRVRGNRRRRNVDRGFVLSDHADWPDLLRTVRDCGARRVLATHGFSDVLARYLRDHEPQVEHAAVLETAFEGESDSEPS